MFDVISGLDQSVPNQRNKVSHDTISTIEDVFQVCNIHEYSPSHALPKKLR